MPFDIGFLELVTIMVIALIVIGPERLPGVARKVGLWVGKTRRFIGTVKADIDREIAADELKRVLREQAKVDEVHEIIEETKDAVRDAKDGIEQARDDYLVRAEEPERQLAQTPSTPDVGATEPAPSGDNDVANSDRPKT